LTASASRFVRSPVGGEVPRWTRHQGSPIHRILIPHLPPSIGRPWRAEAERLPIQVQWVQRVQVVQVVLEAVKPAAEDDGFLRNRLNFG